MADTLKFLLEIGTEEVPDWMIPPALENLKQLFGKILEDNNLPGSVTSVDASPRHLVLRADDLPVGQPDRDELITGPPRSAGDRAAGGFAKKNGVTVEDLQVVETEKGVYFAVRKQTLGRKTIDILADALPAAILKIYWPKSMYWTGQDGPRFIRPIRWLVALLGDEVVRFELAGVKSGNISRGHRKLGAAEVPLTIESHESELEKNYVLISADKRREKIEAGIAELLAGKDLSLKHDAGLLKILTYLTEYPTPILGSFDESYLELPMEVLVTVMRHHQRYFGVLNADGSLAPYFVAVMNTKADPDGLVREGNERVLRARFNDARFFWNFDERQKLADRVEDLRAVTYQKELGSYLDKANRTVEIVKAIGGGADAQRAALLAKCDLTTEMVGEFPELQGVVGGLYAKAQGESEATAQAIYDHYKPTSMDGDIPSTADGRLVGLADKIDTLRECFRIGMVPTGAKDPFALRRAAQGVVKILVEGELTLSITDLAGGDGTLLEFFTDRIRYYFRDVRGFAYDEVNAALAAGSDDLSDLHERLKAVQIVRPTENFEPIAASFKRIKNILRQAEFAGHGEVATDLLKDKEESELYDIFVRVRSEFDAHRARREYGRALEVIASMRPQVDSFFDQVLVNAPEDDIRQNRLTLLASLHNEFSSIADFSEIVTAG
jgi:glycyl-tRNA synthetase beta chain